MSAVRYLKLVVQDHGKSVFGFNRYIFEPNERKEITISKTET
jgi:hypothetical protein